MNACSNTTETANKFMQYHLSTKPLTACEQDYRVTETSDWLLEAFRPSREFKAVKCETK